MGRGTDEPPSNARKDHNKGDRSDEPGPLVSILFLTAEVFLTGCVASIKEWVLAMIKRVLFTEYMIAVAIL